MSQQLKTTPTITSMSSIAGVSVDKALEESFLQLQKIESQIQRADAQVEQFKNQLFTPIYNRRREYLNTIPKFWYVVLAQHEDFQEYVSVEDMKYMELISDLYVEFWDETKTDESDEVTKNSLPKKGFTITVTFKNINDDKDIDMKEQTVTKRFEWVVNAETGTRQLQSEPVAMEWPAKLKNINPEALKQKAKDEGRALNTEEKKSYRQGMRSFFSFWQWTGLKAGKEYRNGEDLATFIAEDIFPAALDYYVLAAPGLGDNDEEGDDCISGEELDLSDDEGNEEEEKEAGDKKRQKQ